MKDYQKQKSLLDEFDEDDFSESTKQVAINFQAPFLECKSNFLKIIGKTDS